MRGQVIKRGESRYLVRISLGRDATGKRRYHNKTIHGTKKIANEYLAKALREMDLGIAVTNSHESLAEFMRRWLRDVVPNGVRVRTARDYQSLTERHILPRLGHLKLSQLTADNIQRAYGEMRDADLSPRTINYVHSVLHNALDYAVRRKYLGINPSKDASRPRHERREMKSMTPAQAEAFLATSSGTRFEALWHVLLLGALRPAEALGLKWADVGADTLTIQRSLVHIPGEGWQFTPPKTRLSRRAVAMPAEAMSLLRGHKAAQNATRLQSGSGWTDHDLVFCTEQGEPLEWRVIARRYLKPLLKRAGLSEFRPYDLRHSCATLLLAKGVNPKVVSERLGHAKVGFTLEVYGHVLPGQQHQAAEAIGDMLYGPSRAMASVR